MLGRCCRPKILGRQCCRPLTCRGVCHRPSCCCTCCHSAHQRSTAPAWWCAHSGTAWRPAHDTPKGLWIKVVAASRRQQRQRRRCVQDEKRGAPCGGGECVLRIGDRAQPCNQAGGAGAMGRGTLQAADSDAAAFLYTQPHCMRICLSARMSTCTHLIAVLHQHSV